jgi:hypothetical protein
MSGGVMGGQSDFVTGTSLLPLLSTYLGHIHIAGTQRYLALTPDLLRKASARFERYAMELQP